jgi:hypothetical protein
MGFCPPRPVEPFSLQQKQSILSGEIDTVGGRGQLHGAAAPLILSDQWPKDMQ